MGTLKPVPPLNLKNMIEEGYHPTAYVLPVTDSVIAMKRISQLRQENKEQFEAFDKAIFDFASEKRNSQSEKTLRAKIKAYQIIKEALPDMPGATLHFCGSSVNSCGTESCDVDLCWAVPVTVDPAVPSDIPYPMHEQGRFDPTRLLRFAMTRIEEIDNVTSLEFVCARVKILKFDIEIDGLLLPVDVNLNNIAGVYNTFMVKHYTKIDERFSILSRILKAWGKKAQVVDSSHGYLNSYTIVLMVLHFLQCGVSPPILPNLNALCPHLFDGNLDLHELERSYEIDLDIRMHRNDTPIGDLLIGFFRYFAMFNYEYEGILLRMGCVSLKANLKDCFFLEEVYDRYTVPKNLNYERLDYIKCSFLDTFYTLQRGPDFKKLMNDERTFMKKV
uniref:PAP-associated domain-containing protein n=1 Tax=Panagrolaimus sp. ES5 TaxID=591445 RepID=A0AC34FMC9_9BILA